MVFVRTWGIAIIVFTCLLNAPYLLIGGCWGMIWFPLTMPVSGIFENYLGGISIHSPINIFVVSLLTSAIWALVPAGLISWWIKKRRNRTESGCQEE